MENGKHSKNSETSDGQKQEEISKSVSPESVSIEAEIVQSERPSVVKFAVKEGVSSEVVKTDSSRFGTVKAVASENGSSNGTSAEDATKAVSTEEVTPEAGKLLTDESAASTLKAVAPENLVSNGSSEEAVQPESVSNEIVTSEAVELVTVTPEAVKPLTDESAAGTLKSVASENLVLNGASAEAVQPESVSTEVATSEAVESVIPEVDELQELLAVSELVKLLTEEFEASTLDSIASTGDHVENLAKAAQSESFSAEQVTSEGLESDVVESIAVTIEDVTSEAVVPTSFTFEEDSHETVPSENVSTEVVTSQPAALEAVASTSTAEETADPVNAPAATSITDSSISDAGILSYSFPGNFKLWHGKPHMPSTSASEKSESNGVETEDEVNDIPEQGAVGGIISKSIPSSFRFWQVKQETVGPRKVREAVLPTDHDVRRQMCAFPVRLGILNVFTAPRNLRLTYAATECGFWRPEGLRQRYLYIQEGRRRPKFLAPIYDGIPEQTVLDSKAIYNGMITLFISDPKLPKDPNLWRDKKRLTATDVYETINVGRRNQNIVFVYGFFDDELPYYPLPSKVK